MNVDIVTIRIKQLEEYWLAKPAMHLCGLVRRSVTKARCISDGRNQTYNALMTATAVH